MNDEMNQNFDHEQETVVVRKEDLQIQPKPNRKVQSGMFGIPEYIGLGLGLLSLLGVLLFYLFFVSPVNSDLAKHKEQRDKLEKELTDSRSKFGNITTTEGKVTELVNSVDSFERSYLPFADVGKAGLYQRINNMISAFGLTNVSGPDYTPLEINDKQQSGGNQNEKQGGRDKLRSLFPGIYISITLEGDYQNLRKFIREMESSNQFVVVNTVELEGAEAKEKREQKQIQQQTKTVQTTQTTTDAMGNIVTVPVQTKVQVKPTPIPPKGKTHGEIVSLRIEMAAYFRRNNIPNVVNSEVKQ
jgi:hypothetical protein